MIKIIRTIFKRIFQFIGLLLAILIIAGLLFRLFGPASHQPLGKLVDVAGTKLHIVATGEKNDKPTLVIEAGAGLSTEYYHWLSEGLKDNLRVIRYDRAGLGYSEENTSPRDSETIARELHELLETSGESPPYILAGHSLGGPYIRTYAKLYPQEVAGMAFIDATHPEQVERFNAAPADSFRFKSVFWGLNIASFFADVGTIGLLESCTDPIFAAEGLPDAINARTRDMLLNGKCLRGYKAELEKYHHNLDLAKTANQFGNIPIRVFTAVEINQEALKERGIIPQKYLRDLVNSQKEYTKLSYDGKQVLINGNHQTIFTKKENAAIINKVLIQLVENLK